MYLRWEEHRAHIDALIKSALAAADPADAVKRVLSGEDVDDVFQPDNLLVQPDVDVRDFENIWLVGAGKASVSMARASLEVLGERVRGGALCVPEGQADESLGPLTVYPAAHPLPDERNIIAAKAVAGVAGDAEEGDLVVCLLSGGGSAHLALPVNGITLTDLQAITNALMLNGAPIEDLNTVRKHCEQLKGGGLARLAAPAYVWSLILSDVIGDRLELIASGPTSPDHTVIYEALSIVEMYSARKIAPAITAYLEEGAESGQGHTVKAGDPLFERVRNTLVGTNYQATTATSRAAREMGFTAESVDVVLDGEARNAARLLIRALVEADDIEKPHAFVLGGETTVTVRGQGNGGRNQELSLAAAIEIDGMRRVAVATLATDGIDGPTSAAGAIVTGETCQQARRLGIDPQEYLDNNDSHTFFSKLDSLVETGPTGTNVNDLAFVLVY